MNNSSVVKSLFGAAFGLALMTSMGASADGYNATTFSKGAQGLPTASIPYNDLDLAKSEGIQTLHNRISRAARKVCGPTHWRQAGSVRLANINRACYQEALTAGHKQIEQAQVASAG